MLKQIKGFITGFLCCALLMGTIGVVFARQGTEMLEALYSDIKIFIDGSQITPKDAGGNAVEPFVVNGTTYLPVRAVANAFGKNVAWDESTNSVIIGDAPVERTKLSELKALEKNRLATLSITDTDNFGNKYSHGIRLAATGSNAYATYDVSAFNKLEATVAPLSDGIKQGDGFKFAFYSVSDSGTKLIWETSEISSITRPYAIEVDLRGVDILMISAVGFNFHELALGNAYLE